jgi:hypothetical protein
MAPKKEVVPELLAEARRLYEETLAPVDDIAAMVGLSRSSFYKRVRDGGWRGRSAMIGAFQFARAPDDGAAAAMTAEPAGRPPAGPVACEESVTPQRRMALALRLQQIAERQMDAVERVLNKITASNQHEAEYGARTLASVARTLREIAALNSSAQETPPDDDDDSIPQDMDAFREELARRIHALIDAREDGETGGGGGPAGATEER